MGKILILANSASGLYDFRNELIQQLLQEYEVYISLPDEEKAPELAKEGSRVFHTPIDRRGINPVRDIKLFCNYWKLMQKIKPDIVLTYTIKPNIYGNICCRLLKIPYLVNITGLGSAFENGGMVQKIVVFLYRIALKNAHCVFFQNETNQKIFEKFHIYGKTVNGKKVRLVPGSGVNLDRHCYQEYPDEKEHMILLYVGRVMKEKGMDELLYAAKQLHEENPTILFQFVGNYEDDYKDIIEQYEQEKIVEHISYQKDITPYYKQASAVLMPSYHEGMSNVILEASANGRPVLASQIPGCQEGFEDGITGLGFLPRDKEALLDTLRKFINLSYEERVQMGKNARAKMEKEFDRRQVVQAYMEEIHGIINVV
ncbi:MAG: glycosyltransferase family 4 protein [Lachnospiraceae bacterium]|nr:glycosyltransferase family 4 protein [Lachnospiraceae bacterium]